MGAKEKDRTVELICAADRIDGVFYRTGKALKKVHEVRAARLHKIRDDPEYSEATRLEIGALLEKLSGHARKHAFLLEFEDTPRQILLALREGS